MRRALTTAGLLVILAIVAGMLTTPALAASQLVVRDIDTSQYPKTMLHLLIQPSMLPSSGGSLEVRILENGEEITDVFVAKYEEERQPVDVVLVIDTSGSMKGAPIRDAVKAARRFVGALNPQDQVSLVTFSTDPKVESPLTGNRAEILDALDGLEASGETALYDGIVEAASTAQRGLSSEKYVIVLSDGGDTMSVNTIDSAISALKHSGAVVFGVALESPEYDPKSLQAVTRSTAGRMLSTTDSAELEGIYGLIAEEIGLQYRVEFESQRPNTIDLEYSIILGAEDDAGTTVVTVENPIHRVIPGTLEGTFLEPTPNTLEVVVFGVLVFLAIALIASAIGLHIVRERPDLESLEIYGGELIETQNAFSGYDTVRDRLIDALDSAVQKRGISGTIQRKLQLAGIKLRASEFIYITVLAGLLLIVSSWVLSRMLPIVLLVMVVAVVLPNVYLKIAAGRRLRKFEQQLPTILDLISGSLRSGWGLQQALDLVVDEIGEPARGEFSRTQNEARLGLPFDEALQRMAKRVDSADLQWTVNAISIQREVGGNLAEVLGIVATTMRERDELSRQVRALTGETRMTMIILGTLPFAILGFLLLTNPDYILDALSSPIGIGGYGLAAFMLGTGIFLMQKMTKVKV